MTSTPMTWNALLLTTIGAFVLACSAESQSGPKPTTPRPTEVGQAAAGSSLDGEYRRTHKVFGPCDDGDGHGRCDAGEVTDELKLRELESGKLKVSASVQDDYVGTCDISGEFDSVPANTRTAGAGSHRWRYTEETSDGKCAVALDANADEIVLSFDNCANIEICNLDISPSYFRRQTKTPLRPTTARRSLRRARASRRTTACHR